MCLPAWPAFLKRSTNQVRFVIIRILVLFLYRFYFLKIFDSESFSSLCISVICIVFFFHIFSSIIFVYFYIFFYHMIIRLHLIYLFYFFYIFSLPVTLYNPLILSVSRSPFLSLGFFVPTASNFAAHAVDTLGYTSYTTGYWTHGLQVGTFARGLSWIGRWTGGWIDKPVDW